MKKIVSVILAAFMCLFVTACSGKGGEKTKSKLAFDISQNAYNKVKIAYDTTEKFSSDIYEAWRLGIYEDDEILSGGNKFLATKLSLTEAELDNGIGRLIADACDKKWEDLSESEKNDYISNAKYMYSSMKEHLFSFCVQVVNNAYIVNGKVDETQAALDEAKNLMKDLSENYSDYEHYPNLKGYYTTTNAFFDFCKNPEGSFEQVKDTINKYRNEARDYVNDLNFIFES